MWLLSCFTGKIYPVKNIERQLTRQTSRTKAVAILGILSILYRRSEFMPHDLERKGRTSGHYSAGGEWDVDHMSTVKPWSCES